MFESVRKGVAKGLKLASAGLGLTLLLARPGWRSTTGTWIPARSRATRRARSARSRPSSRAWATSPTR